MPSERVQRQIDSLLTEAEAAIRELDWATVRARARAALSLDRENGDAQAYLAAAEENLGELPGETAAGAVRGSSRPPEQQPPPEPSAPTSFVGGRYQVIRLLGEGGKKKVYLCHDTLLDRDVAFALIKTERLDEEGRQRIRREAQAMGRLGTHPHIVSVYDMGEEPGNVGTREPGGQGPTPYLVTEYMAGGDVEGLLQESDDQRLPIDQAVRLAQQICRGLAFAHGKGLVHRDLKPGNVWLAGPGPVQSPDSKAQSPPGPSGAGGRGPESAQSVKSVDPSSRGGELVAKIGDFGLAVALDRSRLTRVGMMVGTVAYMPPEQALGGQITAQADLYSLGAMLYELVCGRPPFLGDDSVAIIGQHINTPPVAPNWHNPRCPRPLEALILRLLAKDPGERPRSASEVLTALENLDLSAEAEPSPMGDGSQVLDSLAGGVFVGRQREMGELKAALEDVLSGRGRMITLVGEPGIGKSRTALELSTYAGLRQARCCGAGVTRAPVRPPTGPGSSCCGRMSETAALRTYGPKWERARRTSRRWSLRSGNGYLTYGPLPGWNRTRPGFACSTPSPAFY